MDFSFSTTSLSTASYRIQPLTEEEARDILDWRYPVPYDFYDPPEPEDIDALIQEFVDPANGFYGIRDAEYGFVGFCSFGEDGQVAGGCYEEPALDIGLGMRPELIYQGRGTQFFRAIVAYATETLAANPLRLTVANFNSRAIRIYHRLGFEITSQFLDANHRVPYTIMVRRPG